MRSIFIYCFIVFLTVSCTSSNREPGNKTIKDDSIVSGYPNEITSKGLENLYDKAKWLLYSINCDDTCVFLDRLNIPDRPLFGGLDLRFDGMKTYHDTTEFKFCFFYKDSIRCDVNSIYNYGNLASGVAFKDLSDSAIYFLSETTMYRFNEKGDKSRYYNALQPEVINFIRENKDNLHPWFRKEAIKRKIII